MPTKPLPVYLGLSIKELQALASVSGEALRLYVAVSSFAMGQKTTCFPKWSQIKEAMGKPKADTRNLKRVAKQLEDAGYIKRGEFGAKDRWRLLLKEQVQRERGSNLPPQNNHHTGSNLPSTGGNSNHHTGSNLPPVNKKINKKKNKKINNLSLGTKSVVYSGKEIEFHVLTTDRIERAEILHRLENSKSGRELWLYDPADILEWLEELNKTRHIFTQSKKLMLNYLQTFDPDDV